MLAYVFWHHPVTQAAISEYEDLLDGFHPALATHPPSRFLRSAAFALSSVPWLETQAGYEDSAPEFCLQSEAKLELPAGFTRLDLELRRMTAP